ncbi:hypothetical protein HNR23_002030 [Nocardiopsis mwathae]|uniref:DUF6895 domain-containing protein n=1 Tax=Nocardiopsis mwathae TaxID=1472723 RepID=A0A7W9YGZ0_9ACTN|nr:hypothetical protein [Nocardiopsis mwathae]MBB6171970.1 hypothetical protein [Nocardiopsis mwathae]
MDAATIGSAHRVGDSALDWLDHVRSCFALDHDAADHDLDGGALKSLSELALAVGLVRREAVFGPRSSAVADSLFDFAWRELREGDLLFRLQQHTPAATYPLEIYSTFAAAGYRHEELEELAAHLLSLRAARVPEQVPNRRLAVFAAARRTGLPLYDDPAELTARTWLGATPEPWMLDATNAYGVTHTVFHLTDWGADPEGLPQELEEYLHQWLPVWVEVFDETGFWDLLGEILTVGTCLREPLLFPRVWAHLAKAQRDDGMVPNGVTRPSCDPERAFRNHHHPTIVAVIAATTTVSRALTASAAASGGTA